MKLNRSIIGVVLLTSTAFAQSNTFPASGNVGIGTTAPESQLHIKNAGASTLLLDEPGGVKYSVSSRWGGYFTIWDETNPSFGAFPRLAINPSSGGVGIGTLFPYASLEVTVKSPYGQIGSNNTLALRNRDTTPWNATSIINYDASNTWNANAAIDFLNHNHAGATGAASIRFYTKKPDAILAEAMRIDHLGNVGIGTNNPQAKLDIGVPNAANVNEGIVVERFTGASQFGFKLKSDATGSFRGAITAKGNGLGEVEALTISADGNPGNVGIGTSAPLAKLHIKSNYSGQVGLMIEASDTSDPETYNLRLQPYVLGAGMVGYKFQVSSIVGGINIPLAFGNSGNVGIGETNPQHKLAVNGTIKAKEIIVETAGWSDYVFADNYKLASLNEVEAHIKANKHLPGVPSAAQVAEKGVNLGDMQAALLAKVEELTLHVIAQQKELESLKQENAAFKARFQTLEAR
jgi:hypothetical protein